MNFDLLNIAQIKNVTEQAEYKGGIEDFGDFPEGFCFKINTGTAVWVICADTASDKAVLMNFMRKIKLQFQRNLGIVITGGKDKDTETLSDLINPPTGATLRNETGNLGVTLEGKITDGYWIVMQDWSQCSLKCGGGESLLQRMCIPPKQGGKACDGVAILSRRCNLNPCPGTFVAKRNNVSTSEVKPAIVKIIPFSNKPQRYSKCIVKESDLMYIVSKPEGSNKNLELAVPGRVIMNNKTLSVYSGDGYDNLEAAFDLISTGFNPSLKHDFCFVLRDSVHSVEFCPLGSERTQDKYDEWDYDFNLFKYQCRTKRPVLTFDKEDEADLKKKMDEERQQALITQERTVIKLAEDEKEDELQTEVAQSNKVALQAIQKELNLDAMIEKEEQEKDQMIEDKMLKEIENLKNRQKCAMQKIKEKELENQYNLRVEEKAKELDDVKKKAANEVMVRRSTLKQKVLDMRKKSKRRQSKLKAEMINLRTKIASDMGDALKKGNKDNCSVIGSEKTYWHYCMKAFPNNPVRYGQCKNASFRCEYCCSHEFSEMFLQDRA
jgi:hypothetical protein